MIKTRLIALLSHTKKYIVENILWQWIALLAQIAVVYEIAELIQEVFSGIPPVSDAKRTAVVLAAAMAIRFLCDRMAARASYAASVDVKRILRKNIYEKLLRLGASYREQVSTAEIVQMSSEGVEQLEVYFGKYLPQLFYSLLAPLTLFLVLFRVSFRAALVLLLCVPLIPVSIVIVQKIAKRLLNRYWSVYTGLGDSFLENLQGLTTLKIYQADEQKAKEMDEEARQFRNITMKVLTMQLNSTSVMDICAYGGAAAGMITAICEFAAGKLDLAGTLMILLLASEFFIPLRLLGSFFHIAMNGMAASDKIFALLDLPEPEQGMTKLPEEPAEIHMEKVHFSYEKEREILNGIDMTLNKGTLVSLVGTSGCGKSTIAGLLSGKNRGYTGEIRIGDRSLKEIAETEMMRYMTLVQHNSYLFKGTVEENLRIAKPDASQKEMEEALEKVNLLSFLRTQQGLNTRLLERGENLSGGQRQRLALARALLHDTPVYMFDEATSNIDMESEEMIMEVVRELAKTRVVLLISHRLANVVDSDCICMMKEGQICERGTHEELMEQKGSYYELYESQRQLEEYTKEREAAL